MTKSNGVNYSKTLKSVERRKRVIKRLETQMKLGTKLTKDGVLADLSDKDKTRIGKELEILKARI